VWNELASGNQEMCAVCVGVNSVLQIALFVPYAFVLLTVVRGTSIDVNIPLVAQMVAVFLGLPLILGYLSQKIAFRTVGRETYYNGFVDRISPLSLVGLLFTIVVMFALKGAYIVKNRGKIVQIAIPLAIFFGGRLVVSWGTGVVLGLYYFAALRVE